MSEAYLKPTQSGLGSFCPTLHRLLSVSSEELPFSPCFSRIKISRTSKFGVVMQPAHHHYLLTFLPWNEHLHGGSRVFPAQLLGTFLSLIADQLFLSSQRGWSIQPIFSLSATGLSQVATWLFPSHNQFNYSVFFVLYWSVCASETSISLWFPRL